MTTPGQLFIGGAIGDDGAPKPDQPVLLDPAKLTTHGVIVGMTGSGKTGLGIVLLEEALLAKIPVLVIDPKGDMGNLLLRFPELRASDFRPWIDEAAAQREGSDPDAHAEKVANEWKQGLARWNIGSERLAQLAETSITLYTPGSTAGTPLGLLGSPVTSGTSDVEAMRDEIEAYVSGLLALAGVDADPLSSPEHILTATLLENAWRQGRALDLPSLVLELQDPPVRKLGVFDVDGFFPKKARNKLAMRLNALLASPSFAAWLEGKPLDPQALLYGPGGEPRASILYLAHLSDAERMLVVTLVLSKMITWMRSQSGTSGLRALVYMDEVFGYAPPTAAPPSKKPILTLLKQARAFGVGLVLATQNPVDLDYKALSNAGTWLIGRLQTDRDRQRMIEGMQSALGIADSGDLGTLIGSLEKRQYVLHQTAAAPQKLMSRWAMSYLRGPLTREEVRRLTPNVPVPVPMPVPAPAPAPAAPHVAPGVTVRYVDQSTPWIAAVGGAASGMRLAPALVATVELVFDDKRLSLSHVEHYEAVLFPLGASVEETRVCPVDHDPRDFRADPPPGRAFVESPAPLADAGFYERMKTALAERLRATRTLEVMRNVTLGLCARPGEDRASFDARCAYEADQRADAEAAKLRDRYANRVMKLRDALAAAELAAADRRADVRTHREQTYIQGAGTLLSIFMGGRSSVRGIASVASRYVGGDRHERRADVADQKVQNKLAELAELEQELAREIQTIAEKWTKAAADVTTVSVPLDKSDLRLPELFLAWIPVP